MTGIQPSPQAAERGEPSYIWRAGQQRRLDMIIFAAGAGWGRGAGGRLRCWFISGHLFPLGCDVVGLEYDFQRALESKPGRTMCWAPPEKIFPSRGYLT